MNTNTSNSNIRVAVGLSGGVDSSVAAYLLKEQGYEVIGFHLKLTEGIDAQHARACCSLDASNDARLVAHQLGIPFYVLNQKESFEHYVIEPFVESYRQGLTPNPCIFCNRYIKFGTFLQKARELGCDYLATGHYASIVLEAGRFRLKQAKAQSKDQTYMLYSLSQETLSQVLMPLGDLSSKDEVRAIASDLGLYASDRADSQDICFVEDNDHVAFLKNRGLSMKPGELILDGKVIGRHIGLQNYTIGQRKGLGISYSEPLFVKETNIESNQVILDRGSEIFSTTFEGNDFQAMYEDKDVTDLALHCKIRYSTVTYPCRLTRRGESFSVTADKPLRAVTPGQSAVFYLGDYIYGGGFITKVTTE